MMGYVNCMIWYDMDVDMEMVWYASLWPTIFIFLPSLLHEMLLKYSFSEFPHSTAQVIKYQNHLAGNVWTSSDNTQILQKRVNCIVEIAALAAGRLWI